MENLKTEFLTFMQEMVENNLNLLIKQDAEYARCKEKIKDNLNAVDEILNKLSGEDKKLLDKNAMNEFTISAIEQSFLYKQGWRDCIKFLKMLKIL